MPPIPSRDIETAIRVLKGLYKAIDEADTEVARRNAPESSSELQARLKASRVMERLQSLDETIGELRRWSVRIDQTQTAKYRHGHHQ